MTLIKSISGIRGTIGGEVGDSLSPLDIVRFTASYAAFIRKTGNCSNSIIIGRDARISGEMVSNIVSGTLMSCGFDVLDIQSSFPVDIFLLMGLDYTKNKELGKKCQEFRINFERNLSNSYLKNFNEKIYRNFASLNLGRQIDIVLMKK